MSEWKHSLLSLSVFIAGDETLEQRDCGEGVVSSTGVALNYTLKP